MKFLVLDGNSIFSRAFYGIKMLSNKSGQMTNGIYGFLMTLSKLLSEVGPDRVAIAFDLKEKTFRHKLYEAYKGTRQKTPDELISQLPILKDLLFAMGYKMISCKGYEADDILGTISAYCEKNGFDCVLATGDRDLLQLVSDSVSVRIASTKFGRAESTLYDVPRVKEEYLVSPERLVDIKALQGDTSDNIPGVKGIGKKTAGELVAKFGSIEEIYKNLENLEIKQSVKEKLISGEDMARLSYKLGKIIRDVPIEISEQDFIPRKMDEPSVKKMLAELEFFSLLKKMQLGSGSESANLKTITLGEIEKTFFPKSVLSFVPLIEGGEVKDLFISDGLENIYLFGGEGQDFRRGLEKLLNLPKTKKVVHNLKAFEKALENAKVQISGDIFDVLLASYLLTPSEKDYSVLSLGGIYDVTAPEVAFDDQVGQEAQQLKTYAAQAYMIFKLCGVLEEKLSQNGQLNLLKNIEQPLSKVLASMENEGFLVDKEGLEDYGKELKEELAVIEKEIFALSGEEFNVNSPKQLGVILFEKLKLPYGKRGKTGYSTSADILEKLSEKYEIVQKILQYRTLAKLRSTYCDGIIKLIGPEGRVHSSFNQTETRTGRISSSDPNLQNIPVRTARGRTLRKFFKAKEGCVLIDADYSQIELRVLAHVSGDENMIKAFKNGEDIHAKTASQIMNVPLGEVTGEMRFKAKAVNFGIIYGMSAFSLSKDLGISFQEAQTYIVRYLAHYDKVQSYMERTIEEAKTRGYVETMFSRRRYLPELSSPSFALRGFGERVARNMPIQGAAADIIKIAMINVFKKLEGKRSKIILQVHDELIIEAPISEAEEIEKMLKTEMENAVELLVPLDVNVSKGKTWYDAKS